MYGNHIYGKIDIKVKYILVKDFFKTKCAAKKSLIYIKYKKKTFKTFTNCHVSWDTLNIVVKTIFTQKFILEHDGYFSLIPILKWNVLFLYNCTCLFLSKYHDTKADISLKKGILTRLNIDGWKTICLSSVFSNKKKWCSW